MTHVSRRKLDSQTEKILTSALKELFTYLKPREIDKVFSALVTNTENIMIAKRLAIIIMLFDNISYNEISRSLNLTNQTISRVHSEMYDRPEIYKFINKKLSPWKRKKLLIEILKGLGLSAAKLAAKHAGGRIY
ncbi:MAG: hypothetical protein US60_C0006G0025 [Microgenomates group bacterium GW2011_GWC1_37_8]|uniref:TrpR like protein, YerC/YecD n=1 Tax=Candidatus Woesebacteria bacterium GW2011_GWB1_38_8 TaxID=1618570 RepID=A0A0G0KZK9_9BACT|nr:MAG: hypothetical protein US60_C0006G0025 [Microgenomates group bacterium GW2011_GWC1_37_8]KKQ85098.1 MAG: hypothetical protein UT08_C0010G0025 [Candidatus Woesebacteria bacterium GW2011_GWB1_38_8]